MAAFGQLPVDSVSFMQIKSAIFLHCFFHFFSNMLLTKYVLDNLRDIRCLQSVYIFVRSCYRVSIQTASRTGVKTQGS